MRISYWSSDVCSSDLSFIGVDALKKTADDIRNLSTGNLHIASLPALAFSFLPHVIRAFQKRHPGVSIHLDTHSSSTVRQLVANQQFDIGLATRAHEVAGMSASRSEERRVGKGCVRRCRYRWSPYT